MSTQKFRVYGLDGHRQKASFGESTQDAFVDREVILTTLRQDITGTNDYVEVLITAPTNQLCYTELTKQLSDGVFECCHYGKICLVLGGIEINLS